MIAEVTLEGTRVFVRDDDEGARALWQLGWFGKGTASRGRPLCCCGSSGQQQQQDHRPARTHGRRKKGPGSLNSSEAVARDAAALAGVVERVQLSHCEAFYLAFVVCCVRVTSQDSSDFWRLFCDEDPRFPELLAAYTHYRRLGWAPRSGVAHGVDFLLYRPGSQHSHAPFSVIVTASEQQPQPCWARVCHASRNMVSVAKSLVLCSVGFASLTDRLAPGSCLASAIICDVAISRWVPEQDRESSQAI